MVDWPNRAFLDVGGTEHPIIQAPMAGAGGVELCVAAMRGGALGSLPCGMLSPDAVREQVGQVREAASGPLNLNFFCHRMPRADFDDSAWRALLQPYYEEYRLAWSGPAAMRLPFDADMCGVVEEVQPEVVSFHFGLPEPELLNRVKATDAMVVANVTTVEEARWLEQRGVDAIIAQGFEAGGHTGRFLGSDPAAAMGLFALLPQVVDAVRIPVIAAGGISDGRGIAAAFDLGASAVQLGSAYLHCPESLISEVHRKALRSGTTVMTNLITGGLARGIPGRLIRDLGPVRSEAPPYPLASVALGPIRDAAEKQSECGFSPLWAGQAAALGEALSATELTHKLAADALAILSRRA
jgi:nitronate monooxygenase